MSEVANTPAVAPTATPAAAPPAAAPASGAGKQSNLAWARTIAESIHETPTEVDAAPAAAPSAPAQEAPEPPTVEAAAPKPKEEPEPARRSEEAEQLTAGAIEQQKAWERIHREASKIRQKQEEFKKQRSELERLSALEAKLKDPAQRYRTLEELGGSIGEWQARAVAGDEPNPQVMDLKKAFDDQALAIRQEIAELKAEREQALMSGAVQHAEQQFAASLVETASQYKHFQAAGPQAIDRAYDFAEYVARAMKGRQDIPRSEMPYVRDYLAKVPKAVALDASNLSSYYDRRLAAEASVWAPRQQTEPKGQPAKPPKAETVPKGTLKATLDNATAAQRGAPLTEKDLSKLSPKEFAKAVAAEIAYSEGEE